MTTTEMSQKTKKRRVTFRIETDPDSEVFVTGSFNDWNPTGKKLQDKRGTGEYARTLLLPEGRHEYKFVVNGVWQMDPQNPNWTVNEHGSLNNILTVE